MCFLNSTFSFYFSMIWFSSWLIVFSIEAIQILINILIQNHIQLNSNQIKLIMSAKTLACTRCSNNSTPQQPHHKLKSSKISEANLHKKFNELFQQGKKRQLRKDQVRKEIISKRQAKQSEQCTFKPAINDNHQFFISNDPFIKRQEDWRSSVDKKIETQRKLKQIRQKSSLTFQPKILGNPQAKPRMPTNMLTKQQSLNYTMRIRNSKNKTSYKAIHADHQKLKGMVQEKTTDPFSHRQAPQTKNLSQINQEVSHEKLKTEAQDSPESSLCSQGPVKQSQQGNLIASQPDTTQQAKPIVSQSDNLQSEHQKQNNNSDHLQEVTSQQNFDIDFIDTSSHENFDDEDDPDAVI